MVGLLKSVEGVDYACNFHPERRFPRGLDCEVLTRSALERLDSEASEARFREHVTLYAYENCHRFAIASINCENDHSHFRWTVDTQDDLRLVRMIFDHFGHNEFDWRQVVEAYQSHPHWHAINDHCIQKVA